MAVKAGHQPKLGRSATKQTATSTSKLGSLSAATNFVGKIEAGRGKQQQTTKSTTARLRTAFGPPTRLSSAAVDLRHNPATYNTTRNLLMRYRTRVYVRTYCIVRTYTYVGTVHEYVRTSKMRMQRRGSVPTAEEKENRGPTQHDKTSTTF